MTWNYNILWKRFRWGMMDFPHFLVDLEAPPKNLFLAKMKLDTDTSWLLPPSQETSSFMICSDPRHPKTPAEVRYLDPVKYT